MLGIAGVIAGAAGAIGKMRSAAAAVQAVRGGFREAGGGARGVVAGARALAGNLLPETAAAARREIEELRGRVLRDLDGTIDALRRELAGLRPGGSAEAADAARCQLAAALRCRADVLKASAECEFNLRTCEIEETAGQEILEACGPANGGQEDAPAPAERPVVPFLRQGVQEGFGHDALRREGCYFFALYRWAEHVLDRPLGEDSVVPLFEKCVANGSINANAFVNDPARILNTLCGAQRFRKVSQHSNLPGARRKGDVYVRRVKNGGWGTHFILDINGNTWDSLGSNAHNYRPAGLREIT